MNFSGIYSPLFYCLLRTGQTENFLILTLSEWPPSAQTRLSDGKTLKFRDFVKLLIQCDLCR